MPRELQQGANQDGLAPEFRELLASSWLLVPGD
jgi:hypothetical protein